MATKPSKLSMSWDPVRHLSYRSLGLEAGSIFRDMACGSKYFVERLVLSEKLSYHDGCVNTLNFNPTGELIASGSDDLNVAIWDWAKDSQYPKVHYDSGHSSNVFQAKFMPHSNDMTVVSCARDGQIRVAFLSLANKIQQTKKIAQHRGAAHKLCVEPGSPHVLLTCGEDAVVYNVDLRQPKANKLFTLHNEKKKRIALYSVHINPTNLSEFAVSGRDQHARLFDRRKTTQDTENGVLKKFCPDHLKESNDLFANITCLVYNYNGTELLCSYNDEDIYLFDSTQSSEANFIHRYTGHRNSATVKGVNFFGPRSEFIVSGSDCSHIFLWDKKCEKIVQFLPGDEAGVVNVLEPHPHSTILATSGLDHDVKIWTPTGEKATNLEGLEKQINENGEDRDQERPRGDPVGERLILLMFRQLRRRQARANRQRRSGEGRQPEDTDSSDEDLEDDDDLTESDSESENGELGAPTCAQS